MSVADMVFTITDPTAPVPSIPHLTIAELDRVSLLADREVERVMTCTALIPNPDSIYDTECGWTGKTVVGLFFETAEAIWFCEHDHQNDLKIGDVP